MYKLKIKYVTCVLTLAVISVGIFPLAVGDGGSPTTAVPIVLFEKVTGTWCPPCGSVSPTINKIWDYYGSNKIAIVEYHNGQSTDPGASYYDPFATTETNAKASYYSVSGVPTVVIDGKTKLVGVQTFSTYATEINKSLANPRLFEISISGTISSGTVTVHINQLSATSKTDIKLKTAVLESDKYYAGGTNPDKTYNHIARKLPAEELLSLPLPSGGKDFTKTFTVDSSWDTSKLSFVAFLQSETDKSVLQASFYGYGASPPPVPDVSSVLYITISCTFVAVAYMLFTKKRTVPTRTEKD